MLPSPKAASCRSKNQNSRIENVAVAIAACLALRFALAVKEAPEVLQEMAFLTILMPGLLITRYKLVEIPAVF